MAKRSLGRARSKCCPTVSAFAQPGGQLSGRADDIYVSPNQVRKWGLRTGDTVEGEIRAPKDGERYFAITKLVSVNFDSPKPCAIASTLTT
jgi:transcription termination factor Rho